LFDTLTFAEILGRTTFLGTLSLTVLKSIYHNACSKSKVTHPSYEFCMLKMLA
jgi:hypothetical protein